MDTLITSESADPLSWILALPWASIFVFLWLFVLLRLLWLNNRLKIRLFSFTEAELSQIRQSGVANYTRILRWLADPNRLLMTFLVNNIFLTALIIGLSAWLLFTGFHLFGSASYFLAAVGLTLVIFFAGETLPGYHTLQKMPVRSLVFIRITKIIFNPIITGLLWLDTQAEKFAREREEKAILEEINEKLEDSETEEEKEIFKGIFNFSHLLVRQIMRPRVEITAFSVNLTFHELLNKVNKFAYSRIPVYSDSLDRIEGIIYIKDLLPHIQKNENFKWQTLIRRAYFVPESKKVDELLRSFQEERVHIAIVADEYGGTAGLVTLEDILEQVVGEIRDEFDEEESHFKQIDENTYVFEAKTSFHEFCKVLNIEEDIFEKIKGESESLAGLVLEIFGRLPKVGEKITFDKCLFTIISADVKKIRKIQVQLMESQEAAEKE